MCLPSEILLIPLSLLLHLITLFALIVVYQRCSVLGHSKGEPRSTLEHLENFVKKIEQENETYYRNVLAHMEDLEAKWENKLNNFLNKMNENTPPSSHTSHADDERHDLDLFAKHSSQANGAGDEAFARALHLHRQGYSPEQIAKQLGIGIGETELLISLFNKKDK
ncbi:DUF6115 domain-containing protein [Caldalkalibacillus thermarum]|uniref:DUF6115 domain-containing protein n=1 Tax=Caldalkalibacillus thermarum TaxID=296745 RepID=UPI003B8486AD